jgi:hypothetical protein
MHLPQQQQPLPTHPPTHLVEGCLHIGRLTPGLLKGCGLQAHISDNWYTVKHPAFTPLHN